MNTDTRYTSTKLLCQFILVFNQVSLDARRYSVDRYYKLIGLVITLTFDP